MVVLYINKLIDNEQRAKKPELAGFSLRICC